MRERNVYLATLERIETLTPSVKSFFLRLPPGQKMEFNPGQFISVRLAKGEKIIRKPYSIASSPMDPAFLELCIKRVESGFVSSTLFSFSPGTLIPIDGPDGVFILRNPFDFDLYFVGTGTGIAPLRSMIHWLLHEGFSRPLYLIFGVRNEKEILYEKEFLSLAEKHSHFHFVPTVSRPVNWKGEVGYVQDKVEHYIGDPKNKEVYLCGLPPMVDAVKEKLKSIGFDRKQIHYEKYI